MPFVGQPPVTVVGDEPHDDRESGNSCLFFVVARVVTPLALVSGTARYSNRYWVTEVFISPSMCVSVARYWLPHGACSPTFEYLLVTMGI